MEIESVHTKIIYFSKIHMLTPKEVQVMRENAKVHKKIFDEIRKMLAPWVSAADVNDLCWHIAKENKVLCWFKWVYWFEYNLCLSLNDIVVHGRPLKKIIFQEGDLATFDFGIKDKKIWINTDSAFSTIIGWKDKNIKWAKLIEANKRALYAWIAKARVWNRVWDISAAIEKEIIWAGFFVLKDLTGHAIGYKLHEKPYIPNFGKPWTWVKLKAWMTLAIEPIVWESTEKIIDKWSWEVYTSDGWLWSQYEHTILITDWDPEIII